MKHGSGYGNGKTLLAKLAANALYSTLTISTPGGEISDRSGVFVGTEQLKAQIMESYDTHSTAEYFKAFRRARFVVCVERASAVRMPRLGNTRRPDRCVS